MVPFPGFIHAYKIRQKEDKSLRGTDGTGQYAKLSFMWNNSVVILRPVLVRFYRTGEEPTFERYHSRVLIDKEQKQLLFKKQFTLGRTSKLTPTPWYKEEGSG